jgi:hypothetical protein
MTDPTIPGPPLQKNLQDLGVQGWVRRLGLEVRRLGVEGSHLACAGRQPQKSPGARGSVGVGVGLDFWSAVQRTQGTEDTGTPDHFATPALDYATGHSTHPQDYRLARWDGRALISAKNKNKCVDIKQTA